jgi:hypothetical protein
MRPVSLSASQGQSFEDWVRASLREIEDASQQDALLIADDFTVGTFTELRALPNTGTVTAAQVGNFLATFINDMHKRGSRRAGV